MHPIIIGNEDYKVNRTLTLRTCAYRNQNKRSHSLINLLWKMYFEATPEFAIAFIKLTSTIGCSWPLRRDATKYQIIIFNIKWWFLWTMSVIALLPMFYGAYKNSKNILSFTRSLFGGFNLSQVCIKMTLSKFHYQRYQNLFHEMEEHIQYANAEEKKLYVVYVKRCYKLHLMLTVMAVISAFLVILAPIKISQPFPAISEYPFPADEHPTFEIIYFQQSIATVQCISIPVFDAQIAMLMWYASAKLELLGNQFQKATDHQQFITCVKKHQHLLGFIDQVIVAGRYILVTTVVTCTMSVITSGIHLVANDVIYDKISFIILSIGFSMILYLSAWPSEHLTQMYHRIGMSLYSSPWVKNSKELNNNVLIVIQRAQKSPGIRVSGVLPNLSLSYYATFLSKTFSYFTTLRVLLDKMEINE